MQQVEMQQVDLKELTCKMDELKDAKARLEFDLKQVEKEIEKEVIAFKKMMIRDNTNVPELEIGELKISPETLEKLMLMNK